MKKIAKIVCLSVTLALSACSCPSAPDPYAFAVGDVGARAYCAENLRLCDLIPGNSTCYADPDPARRDAHCSTGGTSSCIGW